MNNNNHPTCVQYKTTDLIYNKVFDSKQLMTRRVK